MSNTYDQWVNPKRVLYVVSALIGFSSSALGLFTYYQQQTEALSVSYTAEAISFPPLMAKDMQLSAATMPLGSLPSNPITDLLSLNIQDNNRERVDKISIKVMPIARYLATTLYKVHDGKLLQTDAQTSIQFSSATATLTIDGLPTLSQGESLSVFVWADCLNIGPFGPIAVSSEFGPAEVSEQYSVSGIAHFFAASIVWLSLGFTVILIWLAVDLLPKRLRDLF